MGGGAAAQGGGAGPSGQPEPQQPAAESLGNLLAQALQGGDRQLLERCLAVGDEKVIKKTVRRLPTSLVVQFLQAAIPRLESRAGRGASLTPWLRHLLHTHAGYLMTAPAAQEHLAALSQVIEARVSLLPPLLRLAGRLDLVLSQLPESDRTEAAPGAAAGGRGPAVIYDDVDDVDAVDAFPNVVVDAAAEAMQQDEM